MDLEEQLRKAARDSGRSMLDLAKSSGLGYASAHGFLTGSRTITVRSASRLAAALGLELRPVKRSSKAKPKG